MFRETAEAKDFEMSTALVGIWAGLAAISERWGRLEVEKGLVEVGNVLKALAVVVLDVEVENGFVEEELPPGFTPNKVSPIFV